jgi:pyrimidine operon attenuation protein/uracil phosphoribosyltransferase
VPEPNEALIMTAHDMKRALNRIAHHIADHNNGAHGLVLVGIRTRGVPLARRLAALIAEFESEMIPVGELDIALYRDDLTLRRDTPRVHRTDIPVDISNRKVVLVDDVLFTGRTVRSALDAVVDLGRPAQIQLGVLIDRGQREFPIRADYVGRKIPVDAQHKVIVRLTEVDGEDRVAVVPS